MRSSFSLLLLMAVLLATTLGAAPPLSNDFPSSESSVQEALRINQLRLEKWRTEPEHAARLQRDLQAFWSMSPERRALLRKLDQDLHQQDSATQKRLWGVLERYHAWLERLREDQRRQIEQASDWQERLRLVKQFREQEWISRLPLPVQNRLRSLPLEKRAEAIARLRQEQRQRQREATQPGGKPPGRRDRPNRLSDFPADVQYYVREVLRPMLTVEQRQDLDDAQNNPWPAYARKVVSLAEKHPGRLPGPIGPLRITDLSPQLQERIRKAPNRYAQLRRAEGKWPEFGVALLALPPGKKTNTLPQRLTPSHPKDFPPFLQDFITRTLDARLDTADRAELQDAEGKWPEYPRTVLRLARKRGLAVPGMTLPGPRELWDRARAALPELPERTLFHFAQNELSGETFKRLWLAPRDSAERERIKEEFFRRDQRELRRLQNLDFQPRPRLRPRPERGPAGGARVD